MANKIESIEIFPGENGGHRVVHNSKREAGKKEGAMAGGVYMERPKPAEDFFGASEDGKVMPHVGKAPSAINRMLRSHALGRLEDGPA